MVTVGSLTLMGIVQVTIAVILWLLGLVTRFWLDGKAGESEQYINVGLFKTTIGSTAIDTSDFLTLVIGSSATELRDVQILVCFGGACSIVSLILANLIVFMGRRFILATLVTLSVLSGVCTMTGVALFHAHYSHLCAVSFSWVFTLLASFLMLSSAAVMGCAAKQGEIEYGDERLYIRIF